MGAHQDAEPTFFGVGMYGVSCDDTNNHVCTSDALGWVLVSKDTLKGLQILTSWNQYSSFSSDETNMRNRETRLKASQQQSLKFMKVAALLHTLQMSWSLPGPVSQFQAP